ncbi:ATP-binding cassette domain-containing protein [Methyloversatilis thermotolerans]|uniref:ATP-binding cassette domain-containing protein n=1 Tax=Methyloversatilis thermotolerans TaxID=1346290 RepID=UPI000367CFCE|nr:ATP-binding cassette domain-containing protein [Methyloversatilis thermotolerans]
MIVLRKLSFSRAGRTLVSNAEARIHDGQRIGLVGANGCGKSTLFALLWGDIVPDTGDCDIPAAWTRARVEQHIDDLDRPALEFALDGDLDFRRIEAAIAAAEAANDGHALGSLHEDMRHIEGYGARARASAMLHGLGFSDEQFARPVGDFSGGWRMRLALARALMCRSDLLLLDEPTNHLDLDAILWLEGWLQAYRGTLIVISHDRDFLDRVVQRIAHIEQGALTLYSGGYTDFENARAEKLAQQQSAFEKQAREVAHLQGYIDRFRAKATKARQAQSRIKALERMEKVVAARVDSPLRFAFREAPAMSDPLLQLERACAAYGERVVLRRVDLTLRPGTRLGLLGRNGAGKSTLVKMLCGELAPSAGERILSRHARIGYFAQHQVEQLREQDSPLVHLTRLAPDAREQELRDYLGGFDFGGDHADAPCGRFSGGERARLALALIIWERPNILLLDEPTNHLDLDMREALLLALQAFDGALVLVSHDRHLIRACCDDLWLVHAGEAGPYAGDLDEYAGWLTAQTQAALRDGNRDEARDARREERALSQADRNALLAKRRPLVKEAEQLEKKLASLNGEKALLDQRLTDAALYEAGGSPELASLLKRQSDLAQQVDAVELRWLEVQDALEQLPVP